MERAREFLRRWQTGSEDLASLAQQFGFDYMAAKGLQYRAKYLAGLHLYPNEFRHAVVVSPDLDDPARKIRLNCPLSPEGKWGQIPGELIEALKEMNEKQHLRVVMQDALALYIHNVDRENFVRVSDLSHRVEAHRYVYFLNQLKVPRTNIRFVSEDSQEDSQYRKSWNKSLRAYIEPRPAGGDFGPKSAISILPKEKWNSKISIRSGAFRFLLVMAFIVFGELPVPRPTV